mgnify:CR=1 FL=1
MNFPPREGDEVKKFKTDIMLREKNSEEPFTDKLRFIYLSLPLFDNIEKGIEKGKIDTQIATAKNFLAMKLTPEQVAAGTGLSLEEVLALMKKQ